MPSKAEKAWSKHWYDNILGQSAFGESRTTWMGFTIIKHPSDMWIYQEILWETKPRLIVETGAFKGGSALYMAHVCDAFQLDTRIVSIDIHQDTSVLPDHPRIEFLLGKSSTDPEVVGRLERTRTMVILDSDHSKQHVLAELDLYAPLVSKGCYLIVEDSNRDGYHLGGGYNGEGPAEALKEWQPTNKGFVVDRSCERLGFTQNPGGYLKRAR